MSKEVVLGVVRHLLTIAGGVVVQKGITDAGTIETISGGLIALIGVIWSIKAKKPAA